jgi:hypothetical protein
MKMIELIINHFFLQYISFDSNTLLFKQKLEGVNPSILGESGGQAPLVEREDLVRAFSPGSTLKPGLKVFRRRGPKCSL